MRVSKRGQIMSKKSLFQFNALVLVLFGIIHVIFSGKVSQLLFSQIEIHKQTSDLISIIGTIYVSIGFFSLFVQNIKEKSSLEKNILLGFLLFWATTFISRIVFVGIGFKLIIPLNLLPFVMSMIFFVHYVQSRRKTHS